MAKATKQKQIKEIVKCGKDPAYFINKCIKIQHPTRGLIPFNTYDFQDECVQDFVDHRFNIILHYYILHKYNELLVVSVS